MRGNRIVMVLAALVAAGGFVLADEGDGRWDLSGTEILDTALGHWICTYVPLNNDLSSYSYTCNGIWDASLGYFPAVTQGTPYIGECDRTGPNSFMCSQIAYGGTADFEVYAIYVSYESRERMPDGTIVTVMDGCTYAPWQDPFVEYPLMGCIYGIPILGGAKQMVVREAPGK